MLRNFLIVTVRNFERHRLFSIINVVSLAVGLAVSFLIFAHVRFEFSYDSDWSGADQIYRVQSESRGGNVRIRWATSFGVMKDQFAEAFESETEAVARLINIDASMRHGDKFFLESVTYGDPEILKIFDLKMIAGDRDLGLRNSSSLMISQSIARKYFGDEEFGALIGREMLVDDQWTQEITGVFEDLPDNTHLQMDFLLPIEPSRYGHRAFMFEEWNNLNNFTYFRLREGVQPERVSERLDQFVEDRFPRAILDVTVESPLDAVGLYAVAVRDIHLRSNARGDFKAPGNINNVYLFASIAVLILMIGAINFMNLSTARGVDRAREVGLRKVMGATRWQLIVQFLGESLAYVLMAVLLAAVMVELSLPAYENILGYTMPRALFLDGVAVASLLGLIAIMALGAGAYPALIISGFRPGTTLGSSRTGGSQRSAKFRNIMVVVQFAISIALIVSAWVVYSQDRFARNISLGYKVADKVVIATNYDERVTQAAVGLRNEFLSIPGVDGVTFMSDTLPFRSTNSFNINPVGSGLTGAVQLAAFGVDEHFFDVFDFKPLAGRVFGPEFGSDRFEAPDDGSYAFVGSIVVSESGARALGYDDPGELAGQEIRDSIDGGRIILMRVVGVVPDIYTRSIDHQIQPMLFHITFNNPGYIALKIRSDDLGATLDRIGEVWADIIPGVPMSRWFMDEDFDNLYMALAERGLLLSIFAGLAVLVASFGLYGLANYAAVRRTKEIGLRKVLGANTLDIVRLLIWQFTKPVAWASLLAWPVGAWILNNWLEGFAYRVDLNPIWFIGAGGGCLAIAWLTVGRHSFRVARIRPADALRYE